MMEIQNDVDFGVRSSMGEWRDESRAVLGSMGRHVQ
jgi:hypothetical protein